MSGRKRVWYLLGLGLVLLIASGMAYLPGNMLILTGEQAIGEVVESTPGEPDVIVVQFTTDEGEEVEASTSMLYGLPPEGSLIQIRYNADDPTQVSMDDPQVMLSVPRQTGPLATVLLIASVVSVGAAVVTWRRNRDQRNAQEKKQPKKPKNPPKNRSQKPGKRQQGKKKKDR